MNTNDICVGLSRRNEALLVVFYFLPFFPSKALVKVQLCWWRWAGVSRTTDATLASLTVHSYVCV